MNEENILDTQAETSEMEADILERMDTTDNTVNTNSPVPRSAKN